MDQCALQLVTNLVLYFILLYTRLVDAKNGVCLLRDASGNLEHVCGGDHEQKFAECKPCPTGYISEIGQKCRPCPPKTFGDTCIQQCNCNEFQRCDNIYGCVNSNTQESFQKGLSSREIIVVSSASAIVFIVIICLCVVIIKCKRMQKEHTTQTGYQEQVATTSENNDQQEIGDTHSYEEIGAVDINVQPEIILNDFVEVVAESDSSYSRTGDAVERNSYLNPYQPLVAHDNTTFSYEELPLQPM